MGAAIGDPEQAQLGRINHRRHTPLGDSGPRAQELREPCNRRAEVHRRAPRDRVGDLRRPLAEIYVPGECRWVGCELREVIQDLLVLQLWQGARPG